MQFYDFVRRFIRFSYALYVIKHTHTRIHMILSSKYRFWILTDHLLAMRSESN